MANNKLGALQLDFLRAFFQRETRFFLTGGAALTGFHLGHRETHDLDLFTPEKPVVNGIRVDPPQEILANKLCTLLSRSEIRDLVDVRALEMAGYRMEDALDAAAAKDRGLTPGQLSWVLSQIELGGDLIPPGGVSAEELRRYLSELIARLARRAFPKG